MAAPASKIEVRLSADQRAALERLVRTGTHPAHARRRAGILLKADADGPDGWTDERIAEALGTSTAMTVWRVRAAVRRRGAGRHPAPEEGPRPPVPQARRRAGGATRRPGLLRAAGGPGPLDDEAAGRQAGRAGGGRVDRPVHRLADASKNELKPWLKQQWVIPPKASAAFVANMEDVLDVYARPLRPGAAGGVRGRGRQAADRRRPRAAAGAAGLAGEAGLRVRAGRHGQPVHGRSSRWAGGGTWR